MPKRCRDCNIINFATANSVKGEKNNSWKGGRWKGKDGYIHLYQPEHPRASSGYILEHIFVWEQINKKPLPKNWVIHHLNGIKHDNRIRNLQALPNKKHYLVLQAKAKRIQELEALLKGQTQFI